MENDDKNTNLDERWQAYLRRRRYGKYLMILGAAVTIVSVTIGILPVTVAAFTGTAYISTPWDQYAGVGVWFGIFLIIVGIVSRIAPNLVEGDGLWIFKLGPFDPR